MTKKEWLEDLNYFVKQLEELHPNPYRNYDKESFYKELEKIMEQQYDLTKDNIVKSIAYLTALLHDAHTSGSLWDYGNQIPIRFEMMNDKLYIVNAEEKNKKALFKEVLFINDINIKTIIKNLENFISYETVAFKNFTISMMLANPTILKIVGLIEGNFYQITYDNYGEINKVQFNDKEKYDYNYLIKPMIYSQGDHRNYDSRYMEEYNTLYIKYRHCREEKDYSMNQFIDDIDKTIKTGVNKVIVDLRNNQGGNSEIIKPLIKRLETFKLENGEIIGLIDGGTFSSGTFALIDLKNIGATIIGSETGGAKGARFGNGKKVTLPNSGVNFSCSTKKFVTTENPQGNLEITQLGDFNTRPNFPMESFKPDYEVYNSIENLKNGEDVVLKSALEYNLNKQKGK